jgi:hypothetical protein
VVAVRAAFKRELDKFAVGVLVLLEVGWVQQRGEWVELDHRDGSHEQRDGQRGQRDGFFHGFRPSCLQITAPAFESGFNATGMANCGCGTIYFA